jgi:RNA polymerase sigma-70 factor (ECF subfamily)
VRFWLLRIATNEVNRWVRRRGRQAAIGLQLELIEDRDNLATDQARQQRARQALLVLPPKLQAVLALHYFEGLALHEVAAVVGCRVGTVKSRLARARTALRRQLSKRR